jgi:DNA polymerase III epsilon subunit-like protein
MLQRQGSNDRATWTDWQRVPTLHMRPIGFLYWRERFWAGDQWVYSLSGHNTLDDLCSRHGVDRSRRTQHGALLDAELLAAVYIELTTTRQFGAAA